MISHYSYYGFTLIYPCNVQIGRVGTVVGTRLTRYGSPPGILLSSECRKLLVARLLSRLISRLCPCLCPHHMAKNRCVARGCALQHTITQGQGEDAIMPDRPWAAKSFPLRPLASQAVRRPTSRMVWSSLPVSQPASSPRPRLPCPGAQLTWPKARLTQLPTTSRFPGPERTCHPSALAL